MDDATESNVELARRGFAAALRGELDAIERLLDPGVHWHGGDPSAPGACHSRDDALAFMRQSEVIRGGQFRLVDAVGAGDRVAVVIEVPSESNLTVANLLTFRDGRVVEMVHYADADEALAALDSPSQ